MDGCVFSGDSIPVPVTYAQFFHTVIFIAFSESTNCSFLADNRLTNTCVVFSINLLGVRVFGELEFWFSSIKVITLVGLLLMGIIIDLGGNPKHDRLGFRYWKHPYGPMGTYLKSHVHSDHLSIFLGFWSTLTNALFAYIGTELIGVTVGEAQAPRKNIPIAIRRTFFRILVFYVGGVFVISLVVPSTDNVSSDLPVSRLKLGLT